MIVNDNDGDGVAMVQFNATASFAGDTTLVDYFWTEGVNIVTVGANGIAFLPLGAHEILLTVIDDTGAKDTDPLIVVVSIAVRPSDRENLLYGANDLVSHRE